MTSVGETLRAERLQRNLGIDEISRELKIPPRFLEAIESEQFGVLPGGVFTKSFVRQYARLLGLNEEELGVRVQRALEPPPEPSPSGHAVEKPTLIAPGFHLPKMEQWESIRDNGLRLPGSLSSAALLVIALLVCSGVYTWMQRPHRVEAPISAPISTPGPQLPVAPAQPPEPASAPPAATPEPGEVSAAQPAQPAISQPQALVPQPVAATTIPQPSTSSVRKVTHADRDASLRVEVTAEEPVWILARVDGKFAFSGTLDAHQSRTVESRGTIMLRLGNAGGVTITLNGKPLGPVGSKGQVRTVQFTSGGFHIEPASPPAADDLL